MYLIIFEATMLTFGKYINVYIPSFSENHGGSDVLCRAWTSWHNIHIPNLHFVVGTTLHIKRVKKIKQFLHI